MLWSFKLSICIAFFLHICHGRIVEDCNLESGDRVLEYQESKQPKNTAITSLETLQPPIRVNQDERKAFRFSLGIYIKMLDMCNDDLSNRRVLCSKYWLSTVGIQGNTNIPIIVRLIQTSTDKLISNFKSLPPVDSPQKTYE